MSTGKRRKEFVSDTLESIIEVACIVNDIEQQLETAVARANNDGEKLEYAQAKKVARELADRVRKEYGDKVLKMYRDEYFPKVKGKADSE